ncbi:hypothetical protein [Paenibacillus sp. PK3_47]|uniref:hypothetical protein n=1 Tax=Paenibacillus sp. PK3_47 TaxID=2072642 RepID=UPI00201D3AD0|nr:hypothetical protein [Paenibacillus sp. PK3_47]
MFFMFFLLFLANFLINSNNPPTGRMWLLMEVWTILISLLLLIKHKLPPMRQILLSILLAAAVAAAYINYSLFTLASTSIITLLSSLAIFSTFNKYREGSLVFLNKKSKISVAVSLLIGVAAGILLGILNLMFMSDLGEFTVKLTYFQVALSPAIYEEIAMRALFNALCLSSLNGRIETRAQHFTVWFMMIIPHVLIHTPDYFIHGGIIGGLIPTIMLAVLFGLPFAALQKKRDITSAMLGHGIVDVIRFCFIGLPG